MPLVSMDTLNLWQHMALPKIVTLTVMYNVVLSARVVLWDL